jgi:hypothetical protein
VSCPKKIVTYIGGHSGRAGDWQRDLESRNFTNLDARPEFILRPSKGWQDDEEGRSIV